MAYIGQKPADKPLGASDITDGIISNSKLAQDIISAETELATAPADTDEFLISDAGVLKRLDASLVGGGKVLQVVTATTTTAVTNTSGSSLSSGLTASITPASSSNKVLVMTSSSISTFGDGTSSSGRSAQVILYRGTTSGTNIREIYVGINQLTTTTSVLNNPRNEVSCIVLDEPSTSSAQTYTLAIAGSGACDITAQADSNRSNIVLMEIAG
tara:strand:+ start:49 stop:690 length:642 start_codon:yes stop_codon:yes gene_type:complete